MLGDGAEWINTIGKNEFAGATRIVDWHHAAEHVASMAELIHPRHSPQWHRERKKWTGKLWKGNVEALARSVHRTLPPGRTEEGEKALAYFLKNREAMRYEEFRNKGYFIGSGVVEAACKTLVCQRLEVVSLCHSQITAATYGT